MVFITKRSLKEKKEKIQSAVEEFSESSVEQTHVPESTELNQGKESVESSSPSEQPEASLSAVQLSDDGQLKDKQSSKSVIYQKIERILEEDLGDLYLKMDAAHQRIFKEEGEKTVRQIERVILTGKSVLSRITELIRRWLKLIPGVNKFFIEQEAKIKADKILEALKPHHHA